jgi:hypothetical protein
MVSNSRFHRWRDAKRRLKVIIAAVGFGSLHRSRREISAKAFEEKML